MKRRVSEVNAEMRQQGLFLQGGDCPVRIKGSIRSVDARLWSSCLGSIALVEAKWTRRPIANAMAVGEKSLPMLRDACAEGFWLRCRAKVKASLVGVLVVKPLSWRCILSHVNGSISTEYPRPLRNVPKRRKGGHSQNGAQSRYSEPT